jgi:hypothetical protein
MDLPKTCCKAIYDSGTKYPCPCDKPATRWYLHNEDICSFCEEHNYVCGIPIAEGAVMNRSDFIKKYKGQDWKALIEEFILKSPDFPGDTTIAGLIGILMADIEFAIKFPE